LAPWEESVTRCGDVTISTEVEAALGREKGGGNTNRPDVNLTVSKNEEEKNYAVNSATINGWRRFKAR
jgi:hypothetical protein